MSLLPFADSDALSFGVELELQLINLSDYDLSAASTDLLALLQRQPFPGQVTPEITTSMIEVATSVQTRHGPLQAQLREMRDTLLAAGRKLNIGLAGGGTHPFQQWSEQRIFPKARYQQVSELYGYLAQQFTIFGQHVHIGCRSGDEALFLLHALSRYVPHFIALAASSPYVQGQDTLFNSARLNSVFAFPLSGRAPFLLKWADFEEQYFEKMTHTGVVKSMKDFYWDIRPKPEYGTIELRVCDTPLDVDTAAALAAYLQALCAMLLEGGEPPPAEDDYLVYTYNRFQACRFGLDGLVVHPKSYEQISLREDVLRTLRRLQPQAEKLDSVMALESIHELVYRGNGALWLREERERVGSVEGVVDAAIRRFAGETS